MIDYFALLEQPRRPRVDLDALKEKYHELSRKERSETDTAALNEGYRILREPKLRLRHLLEVSGLSVENVPVPPELADAFLKTGTLIQEIDGLLVKSTTTALSQALLRSKLSVRQTELDELLRKLERLYDKSVEELNALDQRWTPSGDLAGELSGLISRFAYLTRWIDQLKERKLRLSIEI